MNRVAWIFLLILTLMNSGFGQSARKPHKNGAPPFIEIDKVMPPKPDLGVLQVDDTGNIIDPECKFMASEIARFIAQHRLSQKVDKSAIDRHTTECNKMREIQYKEMEENRKKIYEERVKEEEEIEIQKQRQISACIENCSAQCAAVCPPASVVGGTAASGLVLSDNACPVSCPPRDVCEKRCGLK